MLVNSESRSVLLQQITYRLPIFQASNCGGVAVSGLEMAQNSQRIKWTSEEVDARLKQIMINCYQNCFDTAKIHVQDGARLPSLVAGANIAGFLKVAEAMRDQGEWW